MFFIFLLCDWIYSDMLCDYEIMHQAGGLFLNNPMYETFAWVGLQHTILVNIFNENDNALIHI